MHHPNLSTKLAAAAAPPLSSVPPVAAPVASPSLAPNCALIRSVLSCTNLRTSRKGSTPTATNITPRMSGKGVAASPVVAVNARLDGDGATEAAAPAAPAAPVSCADGTAAGTGSTAAASAVTAGCVRGAGSDSFVALASLVAAAEPKRWRDELAWVSLRGRRATYSRMELASGVLSTEGWRSARSIDDSGGRS